MAEGPSNWIDFYASLVPFGQTAIWAGLAGSALWILRKPINRIASSLANRVEGGDDLETPWLSVKRRKELEGLEEAFPSAPQTTGEAPGEIEVRFTESTQEPLPDSASAWNAYRGQKYASARDLYLAHILTPSKKTGQKYDIFILVQRHKSPDLSDVVRAEFYLGRSWGHQVFSEKPKGDLLGLRTSAFGPFLCVCKVTFADGYQTMLDRYIDFEMGPAVSKRRP